MGSRNAIPSANKSKAKMAATVATRRRGLAAGVTTLTVVGAAARAIETFVFSGRGGSGLGPDGFRSTRSWAISSPEP